MNRLLLVLALASLVKDGRPTDKSLTVNNVSVIIDANVGARVVSLKVDGLEILSSKDVHPRFYGSSLWLSPEGKWKGQGVLDTAPYTVIREDAKEIDLKSEDDLLRGFSFSKQFHVNAGDTSVVIRYTISNISRNAQDVAPWEVTRVPAGGLAFFPEGPHPALSKSDLHVRDSAGIVWYPYDSSRQSHQKIFMSGSAGWTAYIKDGTVFIKKYPDILSEKAIPGEGNVGKAAPGEGNVEKASPGEENVEEAAPGEENVEMYVNQDKTYIELENQGPYRRLQYGDSLTYQVKWYARRLPAGILASVGNAALLAYVGSIVLKP
jgi:hypothetical protein